jgi:hypothetical protein
VTEWRVAPWSNKWLSPLRTSSANGLERSFFPFQLVEYRLRLLQITSLAGVVSAERPPLQGGTVFGREYPRAQGPTGNYCRPRRNRTGAARNVECGSSWCRRNRSVGDRPLQVAPETGGDSVYCRWPRQRSTPHSRSPAGPTTPPHNPPAMSIALQMAKDKGVSRRVSANGDGRRRPANRGGT